MNKVKCTECGWTGGQSRLKKATSQGIVIKEYCPECRSTDIEDKDIAVKQVNKK